METVAISSVRSVGCGIWSAVHVSTGNAWSRAAGYDRRGRDIRASTEPIVQVSE